MGEFAYKLLDRIKLPFVVIILAMEEQDGKGRIIQGGIGSIDTPSVRDYAVQVLEGGREAFLMREKKYGIGEYNHFMNK